ncbi:MAG: hypothetical protein OJJ54_10675, partial [Pseudonocardia sp.]|nr:hypothetical protein [Pseudonocardia sp.]
MEPVDRRTRAAGANAAAPGFARGIPSQRGRDDPRPGRHSSPDAAPGGPSTVDTEMVSVGALLRREGRARHAVDRPIRPRAAHRAEVEAARLEGRQVPGGGTAAPGSPPIGGIRRSAVAGGAMLVAGAMLGAAIVTDSPTGTSDAGTALDGSFPGQGLPDGERSSLAAATLDPGERAPTSWMAVAFPSVLVTADPNAAAPAGTPVRFASGPLAGAGPGTARPSVLTLTPPAPAAPAGPGAV